MQELEALPETPEQADETREAAGRELSGLLDVMARGIVDHPEGVSVNVVQSGSTVVLELTVAKDDIGKVIGRGGAMAGALRTILCNTAAKYNKRAILEIIE